VVRKKYAPKYPRNRGRIKTENTDTPCKAQWLLDLENEKERSTCWGNKKDEPLEHSSRVTGFIVVIPEPARNL